MTLGQVIKEACKSFLSCDECFLICKRDVYPCSSTIDEIEDFVEYRFIEIKEENNDI